MINQRGLMSGALMMTSALFWWISIKKGGNTVNDSNIPASMIGQFEFEMLSLIVAAIIFLSTFVIVMGRGKRKRHYIQFRWSINSSRDVLHNRAITSPLR